MVDWTIVLTTAIGAGAGFAVTYLGYRGTIRTLEAENARLRETRDEEHFRHRQGYYHRTLILLDQLHKAITGVIGMMPGEFLPWMQTFQQEIAGTTLFGREAVQEASERMYRSVLEVQAALPDTSVAPVPDLASTHPDETRRFETRQPLPVSHPPPSTSISEQRLRGTPKSSSCHQPGQLTSGRFWSRSAAKRPPRRRRRS